jgi:hypothetical protein
MRSARSEPAGQASVPANGWRIIHKPPSFSMGVGNTSPIKDLNKCFLSLSNRSTNLRGLHYKAPQNWQKIWEQANHVEPNQCLIHFGACVKSMAKHIHGAVPVFPLPTFFKILFDKFIDCLTAIRDVLFCKKPWKFVCAIVNTLVRLILVL